MAVDIRTDTGGLTTTYVYDLMDRLTSVTADFLYFQWRQYRHLRL